ncbi:GntR family transcriptional regulator [Litorisediminicola beolgyonensis]
MTKAQALDDMRARILTGALAPGTDLDEAQFCAEYSLSRTPLREIFHRLTGEGVLAQAPGRPPRVAGLEMGGFRNLLATAPVLFTSVARHAAQQHVADDLVRLKDAQRDLMQALADERPMALILGDYRFHETLADLTLNAYLIPGHRRLLIDVTRYGREFYVFDKKKERKAIKKALEQHDRLIDAIEARDGDAAADIALAHWKVARAAIEEALTPEPLPLVSF